MPEISMEEARQAMINKRFGGNANGAKTSDGARRNKKSVHRSAADDKKLQGVLKKIGLNQLNNIEEVNIFKSNGEVIHITNPKIQANVPSNTFVVGGHSEIKQVTDLLPEIYYQLGPEGIARLMKLAESMGMGNAAASAQAAAAAVEDDDEVPELVENFEEAANK